MTMVFMMPVLSFVRWVRAYQINRLFPSRPTSLYKEAVISLHLWYLTKKIHGFTSQKTKVLKYY